jgi:hypothetical protein
MTTGHVNHTWEFECILENGKRLKTWFYADTEQDATRRITEYMGAKLISIKEIDDPLELRKKEQEKLKIKQEIERKKHEDREMKNYD